MSIGSIPLRYKVTIDPDQCMLCGRCVENLFGTGEARTAA